MVVYPMSMDYVLMVILLQPLGAANVSQPGVPGQVCADGSLPDVNGLCPDGNPPPALGAANVSQPVVPGQVCADGSLPDVNGLCPDGNPPPALGAQM